MQTRVGGVVRRLAGAFALLVAAGLCAPNASAQRNPYGYGEKGGVQPTLSVTPPELEKVDIVEHLNGPLPKDAAFVDSDGKPVHLGDYFDGKRPTLLVFAYHTCPMLCSLVLDATTRGLKDVPWSVGKEFDVVSVSIDPRDNPASATKKRDEVVMKYGRGTGPTRTTGWHFLTGDEANIRRVTDAIGFDFRYDERQGQYAHPAAIYLLTPSGTIARYLYGIQFEPSDLKLGLLEASEGRSITTVERLLLYCYHYDPQGKKYAIVAMRVMRVGGVITMFLIGGLIATLWWRERRNARTKPGSNSRNSSPTAPSKTAPNAT